MLSEEVVVEWILYKSHVIHSFLNLLSLLYTWGFSGIRLMVLKRGLDDEVICEQIKSPNDDLYVVLLG